MAEDALVQILASWLDLKCRQLSGGPSGLGYGWWASGREVQLSGPEGLSLLDSLMGTS